MAIASGPIQESIAERLMDVAEHRPGAGTNAEKE
jgi:hypothetical protein